MCDRKLSRVIVSRINWALQCTYLCWLATSFAHCWTHLLAKTIYTCRYDEKLFVECNDDRSARVDITNGVLQRQEYRSFVFSWLQYSIATCRLACYYILPTEDTCYFNGLLVASCFPCFSFFFQCRASRWHIAISFVLFFLVVFRRVQIVWGRLF